MRLLKLITVIGVVVLAGKVGTADALLVPSGFKLEASNGYSMVVWAIPSHRGRPAGVLILVSGQSGGAVYSTRAALTNTSIQANLGELGEIDVSFQPSGQAKAQSPVCERKGIEFDAGLYVGKIEFNGEEGYTQVNATSAPGDLQFALNVLCPGAFGGRSPGLPGAELRLRQVGAGPAGSFKANKNRPGASASFEASISERNGGVSIKRYAGARAPSDAFSYDPLLSIATVSPPAPFSGHATYRRDAARANRWTGTLAVDFPGRSHVSLTGASFRPNLVHAVWNTAGPRHG